MNRKLLAVLFVLCAVQVSLGRSRGGDRLKCNGAKKLTCCNNIKKENFIEGLLGVVAKLIDIKADGTASCSPVSVAVIGGAAGAQSCSGQSLCCDDTNTVGFLAVGCSQAVGTFG